MSKGRSIVPEDFLEQLKKLQNRKINLKVNVKISQPFIDRKTTVFVDIARANPKSQSCYQ